MKSIPAALRDVARPFFTLEQRCACGCCLFIEIQQDQTYAGVSLSTELVKLGIAWTNAHANHQEPKKP
jgi:hypothetical protein